MLEYYSGVCVCVCLSCCLFVCILMFLHSWRVSKQPHNWQPAALVGSLCVRVCLWSVVGWRVDGGFVGGWEAKKPCLKMTDGDV